MRVLVACEFSGVVRRAFAARGHTAWSCDILPAEDGSEFHWEADICEVLRMTPGYWDLLIAHPPCTYLTNAGAKHLYIGGKKKNGPDERRWTDMRAAAQFFNELWLADIPGICVENPVMHCHATKLIANDYAQIVQPYEYGHAETKKTCLWLRGLPLLQPTKIIPPDYERFPPGKGNGYDPRVHYASPGPDRWKERSRTMTGIAEAMAAQWGGTC